MSYTKTTWINNQAPAINAANLNKIEEGISAADTAVTALETRIEALESADGITAGYVPTAQGDGTWEWAAQSGGGGGGTGGSTVTAEQGAWTAGELVGKVTVDGAVTRMYAPKLAVTSLTNSEMLTISGTEGGAATSTTLEGSYGVATTSAAGLMSANDKTVLGTLSAQMSSKANVRTVVNKTSSDTSQTLAADTFYIWPEMSALTIACPATGGEYAFRFTSGNTATTLTITGITMPDGFTVEANKVYEINVYEGYGLAVSWAVST